MKWLWIFVALVLAALGALYFVKMDTPASAGNAATSTAMQTYASRDLGFSFAYPHTYALEERDMRNSQDATLHFATITLTDKVAAANIPVGGEGPPSITIDVFANDHRQPTLEAWVKRATSSNFRLSPDGALAPVRFAGIDGLSYAWDGLYRGESVAFPHGDHVIIASVTSLTPEDAIRADFQQMLASIVLQ